MSRFNRDDEKTAFGNVKITRKQERKNYNNLTKFTNKLTFEGMAYFTIMSF